MLLEPWRRSAAGAFPLIMRAALAIVACSAVDGLSLLRKLQEARSVGSSSRQLQGEHGGPPCACKADDPSWKAAPKRAPLCIFFDLGAGNGESELAFLGKSTGALANIHYDTGAWKKEQCLSYLVESNPRFKPQLEALATKYRGQIFPHVQEAIYMCDKEAENFFLDSML